MNNRMNWLLSIYEYAQLSAERAMIEQCRKPEALARAGRECRVSQSIGADGSGSNPGEILVCSDAGLGRDRFELFPEDESELRNRDHAVRKRTGQDGRADEQPACASILRH
jgi:hypothetical protein